MLRVRLDINFPIRRLGDLFQQWQQRLTTNVRVHADPAALCQTRELVQAARSHKPNASQTQTNANRKFFSRFTR